ncbi:hypothetical protein ACLPHM_04350 [Paenalcaligenes sp. Me131]|uniref:hypothetical protein n=1 Tax=Paenalcaligenes sp. Me131 TaxID=3392636 RepID=UPI003D2A5529
MIYQKPHQGINPSLSAVAFLNTEKRSPEQKQIQEQQLSEIRRNFVRNIKRTSR